MHHKASTEFKDDNEDDDGEEVEGCAIDCIKASKGELDLRR